MAASKADYLEALHLERAALLGSREREEKYRRIAEIDAQLDQAGVKVAPVTVPAEFKPAGKAK